MRILFSGLLAAGLLSNQMVQAEGCARPADKTAFDVAGLKSQLMVTAITCEATEKYNAFIGRFRPNLLAEERVLNAYFARNYGRRAQPEHDDYITSLANSQSQNGLKAGTGFCNANISTFDKVMALSSGSELPAFATSQSPNQPITLVDCTTAEPRARVRQASATTSSTHRVR